MTPAGYVAQRLGAFFHFNMSTYCGIEHCPPDLPMTDFAPTELDMGQWLDAAVAMGARYAVLTTKHHDGFCLWPTRHSHRSIAGSPCGVGGRDLVAEFVAACRRRGVAPGLYFSVSDQAKGPSVPPGKVDLGPFEGPHYAFVAAQLAELLQNYGELACVWLDGCWAGHVVPRGEDVTVPARRLRALCHSLQPGCQVLYNWHRDTLGNGMADVRATEVQCGLPCADNVAPHETCSQGTTSHWFWERHDRPFAADWLYHHRILPSIAAQGCHLLNLAPDPRGLLPEATVAMCKDLGRLMAATRTFRDYRRIHIYQPEWTWTGAWSAAHGPHGSASSGQGPLRAEVRFVGDAVRLIGRRLERGALLDLDLDGEPLLAGLQTRCDDGMVIPRQILYERHDLPGAEHVLGIQTRPGPAADGVVLDRCALEAVEVGWSRAT